MRRRANHKQKGQNSLIHSTELEDIEPAEIVYAGLQQFFGVILPTQTADDMTIIERFTKEQEYNKSHQLFAPFDDEEMGERLPGMFRTEVEDDGHECLNMIFDNGEHFVFDHAEQTLYYVNRIPQSFFIHKFLEKAVYDFIVEHNLQRGFLPIYCVRNEVSVKSFIRLLLDHEERIVDLPNIILPDSLRHKGLGLKLISEIHEACKRTGYRLQLSMMVESFYNRMVARGATIIDSDTVEINDATCFGLISE